MASLMACFAPLRAFQNGAGEILFAERGNIVRSLFLPCGQCTGCRLERSRQWAMRCVHEAQMHAENCFITLTFDEDHIPAGGSLDYRIWQRFMKRLRKSIEPRKVRFYMCGEYGEKFDRPHFHACLFGYNFPDRVFWSKAAGGASLDRSRSLERLWPFGFASVGEVTFESAGYVARYIMKKVNGDAAELHYRRVDESTGEVTVLMPEFNFMSLKPGIGADWYKRFRVDVFPGDYVIVNGRKCKPPKYYDVLYAGDFPDDWANVQYDRYKRGNLCAPDATDERLKVREQVLKARVKFFKRSIA